MDRLVSLQLSLHDALPLVQSLLGCKIYLNIPNIPNIPKIQQQKNLVLSPTAQCTSRAACKVRVGWSQIYERAGRCHTHPRRNKVRGGAHFISRAHTHTRSKRNKKAQSAASCTSPSTGRAGNFAQVWSTTERQLRVGGEAAASGGLTYC